MIMQIEEGFWEEQGKIDRWIGCVTGILWAKKLLTFDDARDLTRKDVAEFRKGGDFGHLGANR
jgi:hypothetical protein